ncbi:isopenicillin N synthase family dioxygenase [Aliiruegeria lutimaris]|uniref:2-oxoglutarate-dependent ethylene/succinate-forming enzyme n=1 Tax=Aliiruegeria lutimaris TaxID=571298 RepID=A0A1G9D2C5_9RHOB|nr:2-oxoglutarate and iron-dependent oxygenase domain-containing protein [Aliiruegeria lutimaris]SDK58080.1 Isopenicillin N synthase [Aliiruegeria lutimaris]
MIPKLDWRRFSEATDREGFISDLSAAISGPGLFRLTHHGIDPELICDAFTGSTSVFDLTEAEKRTLAMQAGPHNRGWARLGVERLADGSSVLERREAFNIGLELPRTDPRVATRQRFRTQTPWPAIPGFRDTMLSYYDAVLELGLALHRAFAAELSLAPDCFDPLFVDPLATLRLITYPPGTGSDAETGAGTHTDFGSISLLLTDDQPGLQAKLRNGDWIDVKPDSDSFIILLGDALECWTGGKYAATPHRVQSPKHRRQAINFYLDPAPEASLSPFPGFGKAVQRPQKYVDYLAEGLSAAHQVMQR